MVETGSFFESGKTAALVGAMRGWSFRTVRSSPFISFFGVGVHEEGEHYPVRSHGGLYDVGVVALVGGLVYVLEVLAGVLGVLLEVVVRAVCDPFELRPAGERVVVLDVHRALGVVGELLLGVLVAAEVLLPDAEVEVPVPALSIQYSCHSSSVPGLTKNSISICSNSRVRKIKLPGVISLRKDLPCCAIPNGTFTRLVWNTFLKFTKIPCAVSGLRYAMFSGS
jgi:hypothetical protein